MNEKENELLAGLLISKAQNIPDSVKKAFVQRSVEDARQLKKTIEQDGFVDLQKLSFIIYRAYSLGAALYDGDKLIDREIEKNDEIDEMSNYKNDDTKIVDINNFKRAQS